MIRIIGLGNPMRNDDGIGPAVIQELLRNGFDDNLIDYGIDAFSVLQNLLHDETIIIVDCADMGLAPGSIRTFSVDQARLNKIDRFVSLHGYRFAEIYNLARKMGANPRCIVVGVQPASLGFNDKLSPEVQKAVPRLLQIITRELKKYEQENSNN